MKTFGWICIVFGSLSFIGAVLAGHNVFGPSFWLALGIGLVYKSKEKEKHNNEESSTNELQQISKVEINPKQSIETVKQKTFWEDYKENNPSEAQEIENLLKIDMSELSNRDAREKIQMLERISKNMECTISEIKAVYLKGIEKCSAHLIPQMIETTKKEMANEVNMFNILESNTCSALMIEWLKELQENALNNESYWRKWKTNNPEKAVALESLTKVDFDVMDDEDVKQTITSFEGMADFKGLSDWNQIKEITLQYFEDMTKDLCEEEMLVLFDHLISEEANHTNACPSNTFAYYSRLWYLESLKAKETETLTPEQNFRNEYKRKLIYKIGTNAFIPLFCEGYDSPIAHEIMNLMYQHLRNGELKAEAEKNGFGDKFIHIIVEETEKITEKYCHASLQECIEFYNFPDKKVLTRDRCPNCGSRHVLDNYEFGLECMDCSYTWFAPFGKRLYL